MIAWVDLETTGLDPDDDEVLEVACIVTTDDLTEVARFERIVAARRPFEGLPERVQEMHTKNGLWLRCVEAGAPELRQVEQELCEFLEATCHGEKPQLGGNTISFDRAFMKVHLPRAEAMLHYRNIDCTTLNELARRFWPRLHERRPAPGHAHRSCDDAEESIATLRYYLGAFNSWASSFEREVAEVATDRTGAVRAALYRHFNVDLLSADEFALAVDEVIAAVRG